jgi:hypothetical protein
LPYSEAREDRRDRYRRPHRHAGGAERGVPSLEATRIPPPAGAVATDGPAAWQAPVRPPIRVVATIRDDVAAKMYARHQIDRASYLAARKYQSIHEVAEGTRIRSCDPSMPAISGGQGDAAEGIDHRLRARRDLERLEGQLAERYGREAVNLLRDVLGAGRTIQAAARDRGEVGIRIAGLVDFFAAAWTRSRRSSGARTRSRRSSGLPPRARPA